MVGSTANRLKVIFLGGKQAGVIGLLTTVAVGCNVLAVVTGSDIVKELAKRLGLPIYYSVKQDEIIELLPETDLMISVHSREVIPMEILDAVRIGGINVHPCLSEYKGRNPVKRFVENGKAKASVGVHRMVEEVDCGEVLEEMFVDIDRDVITTVTEVYNSLYPYYAIALLDVLGRLQNA